MNTLVKHISVVDRRFFKLNVMKTQNCGQLKHYLNCLYNMRRDLADSSIFVVGVINRFQKALVNSDPEKY